MCVANYWFPQNQQFATHRRQKRLFKAPGFIMLSVGLLLDMLMPHRRPLEPWMHYWQAAALTLLARAAWLGPPLRAPNRWRGKAPARHQNRRQ